MPNSVGMQEQFTNVRKKLDQLGYRQPLGLDSLPLTERLLSDLVWTTESLRKTKAEMDQKMQVRGKVEECIASYKADNGKLIKENNHLQQKIIVLRQEKDEMEREIKSSLRRCQGQNDDLKFFNTQCLHKIKAFENEVKSMAEKIILLQEKNFQAVVHASGGQKKSIPFRRQRMDLSAHLPAPIDPVGEMCCAVARTWAVHGQLIGSKEAQDVVEMVGGRCEEITVQMVRLQEELELANRKMDNFRKQVESRDGEVSRLKGMLEGGRSLEAVSKENRQRSTERLVTQLNLQLDLMQQRNDELEKQLAAVQKTQSQNQEIVQDAENLQSIRIAKGENDLKSCKSTGVGNDLTLLDCPSRDEEYILSILEQLEKNKDYLHKRIDKLIANERDIVVEMERLVSSGKSNDGTDRYMEVYMRGVEEDRDYWRSEAQSLTQLVRTQQEQLVRKATSSSKKYVSAGSNNKKEKAMENQLRLLEDERDKLVRDLELMKHKVVLSRPGSGTKDKIAEKGEEESAELFKVKQERDNLQNLLDKFERQVHDIQGNVRVLSQERDSINKLYEDTRSELQRVRQELITFPKSSGKVSLSAQAILRRTEAERDDSIADLRRMTTERDSLRERLRVATDSALSDKARLEQRLEDMSASMRLLATDKDDATDQVGNHKKRIYELEEQSKLVSKKLEEAIHDLDESRTSYQQLQLQSNASLHRIEQTERHASQVQNQLQESQDRVTILQERLISMEKELKVQRDECVRLRSTISQLDHEKDSLQASIDQRAESLLSLETELTHREQVIGELRTSLKTAEQQVCRVQEASVAKEREVVGLRKQLDQTKANISQETRRNEDLIRENGRLQDDLTTMTRENQALQSELQDTAEEKERFRLKCQDLSNQINRTDEQLAHKEQERTSLLEQYRLLSLEADRFQTQSHNLESSTSALKMELLTRDQEIKRLADQANTLEMETDEQREILKSYEMQVSTLNSSISDLREQLRFESETKEDAMRDVHSLRDLLSRVETSKDQLARQLTSTTLHLEQAESHGHEITHENASLRNQLTGEEANVKNLETVLAASREKEFQSQLEAQERQAELNMLRDRLELNETKVDQQQRELSRLRTRNSELEGEVERLHRQITSERFEKERATQEMRRYQQHQVNTSALLGTTPIQRNPSSSTHISLSGENVSPVSQSYQQITNGAGDHPS